MSVKLRTATRKAATYDACSGRAQSYATSVHTLLASTLLTHTNIQMTNNDTHIHRSVYTDKAQCRFVSSMSYRM